MSGAAPATDSLSPEFCFRLALLVARQVRQVTHRPARISQGWSAALELSLLRSTTAAEFGAILRWGHLPFWLLFTVTPNINYRGITALRPVRFLGEFVVVAQGVPSPLTLIGQASLLLLLVFLADAAVTIWRRADHWSTRIMISAMVFS